jgi:hypothetical protein
LASRLKKQLIAALLLISCLACAWLLFLMPSKKHHRLQHLSQADSLVLGTLSKFGIPEKQISVRSRRVDSSFTRKVYVVSVPPYFPKIRFHTALKGRFTGYGISLPARIIFPDKDIDIQLYYRNTVIRTIKMVMDDDLKIGQGAAGVQP